MFRSLLLTTCLLAPLLSHADGLADLKAALPRLASAQPIKAQLSVKTQSRDGDGNDATVDHGAASIWVEDDAQGLRTQIGADLLAKLRAEDVAHEQDANAPTPTSLALQQLDARDVRSLTSAADTLGRILARAGFKQESSTTLNGQPARLLTFDLGPGPLRERQQKYVKKVEGGLQVWIAADGTPLEARSKLKISGRAFVFISFESTQTDRLVFARTGDRLIVVTREQAQSSSGGGEKGDSTTSYVLQVKG